MLQGREIKRPLDSHRARDDVSYKNKDSSILMNINFDK